MVCLSLLNKISAPCSIVLVIVSAFLMVSVEWRLTKISSFFLSFLFFSAVVGVEVMGILSVGSLVVSEFSTKREMTMVMSGVVSLEISVASGTEGCEVIVGVAWYLGCLLTSVLVLVSVGIFKTLDSFTSYYVEILFSIEFAFVVY